ncbi:hypothetical protein GCM10017083_49110 [Thalassobaculum fulvum]|uniref:histidine kinase n=1 Tax=Thalassobaculum fulvum TaxID=1633335 RepID=A0A918XX21_9PROT|nr:HAMP domain-containing sensor histidine kinase [Thalassobaculum fulvum]GHD61580.1 hypothetical protein GCM10017083_49110 [Thalassobaculum fulvum]
MDTSPSHVLFDTLSEAVVAVSDRAEIVFVNRSAEKLFGYARSSLLGRPLDILIPERHRSAHSRHLADFRDSGVTARMKNDRTEVRGQRSDGTEFDGEASICRSELNGTQVFIALIRDVSERKAGESLLAEAEREQRVILDSCADGILVLSAQTGLVVRSNERAAELLGHELRDMIGQPLDSLGLNSRNVGDLPSTPDDHADPILFEEVVTRPDGTALPVEVLASTTRLGFGPAVVCCVRDISQRKAHERDLIEARNAALRANRHKSVFLAGVSHELRTPLNAIIAFAEIIRDQTYGNSPLAHTKYREYANDVAESGVHLVSVINDLIDLSRVEMGMMVLQHETVDLHDIAAQCIRTLRSLIDDKSIDCHARIGEAARWLRADPKAVRQMIINLLSNAIRHTPSGGTIEIAAAVGGDGELLVSVEDSGAGIPSSRLAWVTTPFNSSESGVAAERVGTGLGLAITRSLLELHGGTLSIRSEVDAGTCVTLAFPADRIPQRGAGLGCRRDPASSHRKTFLKLVPAGNRDDGSPAHGKSTGHEHP